MYCFDSKTYSLIAAKTASLCSVSSETPDEPDHIEHFEHPVGCWGSCLCHDKLIQIPGFVRSVWNSVLCYWSNKDSDWAPKSAHRNAALHGPRWGSTRTFHTRCYDFLLYFAISWLNTWQSEISWLPSTISKVPLLPKGRYTTARWGILARWLWNVFSCNSNSMDEKFLKIG